MIPELLSSAMQFSNDMVAARKKEIQPIDYERQKKDAESMKRMGQILSIKSTIKKIKHYATDHQHSAIK